MRRPPDWTTFPRYPVTAGTILLAIGITLAWWAKVDLSRIFETAAIRRGELWRLLTSALPHANVLHLAFNIAWVWVFGTLIEDELGHFATFGIFAFLAAGSSAAEFAVLDGGVGLSGVGYGLFGLLWIAGRYDRRFSDEVDARTVSLFVVWFFICIVTTVLGAMSVANIAHGVGLGLGALLGMALSHRGRVRVAFLIFGTMSFAACIASAVYARPYINLSKTAGEQEGYEGYEALDRNDNAAAAKWLQDATRMRPQDARNWFNLGIAFQRTNRTDEAAEAYKTAHTLDPTNADYTVAYLATRLNR